MKAKVVCVKRMRVMRADGTTKCFRMSEFMAIDVGYN